MLSPAVGATCWLRAACDLLIVTAACLPLHAKLAIATPPPFLPPMRQGMDLAAELRRLLVGYNRGLGAEAT